MNQRNVCYFVTRPQPLAFPEEIARQFAAEIFWGGILVQEGSQRELEFLEIASHYNLTPYLSKSKTLLCDKNEIENHPFYFLHVKQDKDYPIPHCFDYDQVCFADSKLICRSGAEQTRKIVLDPKKSKYNLDIMTSPWWPQPLLISRALKQTLEKEAITGYMTVPCLEKGTQYPDEFFDFEVEDRALNEQANYHQLIVKAKVKHNPRVGTVQVTGQCPRCGTVQDYYTDIKTGSEGEFRRTDFDEVDIQLYDGLISDNLGKFDVSTKTTIISAKFLSILLRSDVHGLSRYSPLFKLPHRFVDIVE